jgi:serine/threonine protein kinase
VKRISREEIDGPTLDLNMRISAALHDSRSIGGAERHVLQTLTCHHHAEPNPELASLVHETDSALGRPPRPEGRRHGPPQWFFVVLERCDGNLHDFMCASLAVCHEMVVRSLKMEAATALRRAEEDEASSHDHAGLDEARTAFESVAEDLARAEHMAASWVKRFPWLQSVSSPRDLKKVLLATCRQLCRGVSLLHNQGICGYRQIIHNSLKPTNVLVRGDVVKIAELRCADGTGLTHSGRIHRSPSDVTELTFRGSLMDEDAQGPSPPDGRLGLEVPPDDSGPAVREGHLHHAAKSSPDLAALEQVSYHGGAVGISARAAAHITDRTSQLHTQVLMQSRSPQQQVLLGGFDAADLAWGMVPRKEAYSARRRIKSKILARQRRGVDWGGKRAQQGVSTTEFGRAAGKVGESLARERGVIAAQRALEALKLVELGQSTPSEESEAARASDVFSQFREFQMYGALPSPVEPFADPSPSAKVESYRSKPRSATMDESSLEEQPSDAVGLMLAPSDEGEIQQISSTRSYAAAAGKKDDEVLSVADSEASQVTRRSSVAEPVFYPSTHLRLSATSTHQDMVNAIAAAVTEAAEGQNPTLRVRAADITPADLAATAAGVETPMVVAAAAAAIASHATGEATRDAPTSSVPPESGRNHWIAAQTLEDPSYRDCFALGCLLFYILTFGDHPYGTAVGGERAARILLGVPPETERLLFVERDSDVSVVHASPDGLARLQARRKLNLAETGPEAEHLVRSLLKPDVTRRISPVGALDHIVFWPRASKLRLMLLISEGLPVSQARPRKARRHSGTLPVTAKRSDGVEEVSDDSPEGWDDDSPNESKKGRHERGNGALTVEDADYAADIQNTFSRQLGDAVWAPHFPPPPGLHSWNDALGDTTGHLHQTPAQYEAGFAGFYNHYALVRFCRNLYAHAPTLVRAGVFSSTESVEDHICGSFPWIFLQLWRVDCRHGNRFAIQLSGAEPSDAGSVSSALKTSPPLNPMSPPPLLAPAFPKLDSISLPPPQSGPPPEPAKITTVHRHQDKAIVPTWTAEPVSASEPKSPPKRHPSPRKHPKRDGGTVRRSQSVMAVPAEDAEKVVSSAAINDRTAPVESPRPAGRRSKRARRPRA